MLSLLLILIIAGLGIFGIYLAIDYCEYLRKYRHQQWESLTFERAFGIPREEFPINPIRPLKFIASIFSSGDKHDLSTSAYKLKLKLVMISFIFFFILMIVIY